MTASSQTPDAAQAAESPDEQPQLPAPTPVLQAAVAVIDAQMQASEGALTSEQIAEAEQTASILFDGAHVQAAVNAAREQQYAEDKAELDERGRALAAMSGVKRQLNAVLRLCEGRKGDDLLLVSAVAAAAEYGATALDDLPMTLAWTRSAEIPEATDPVKKVLVECVSSYGGRAVLVVTGDDRQALASLLDAELVRDIHAPCPHSKACGLSDDETPYPVDPADRKLSGWTRIRHGGLDEPARWYCSPGCVSNALARAGEQLDAADRQAELDGGL